MTKPSTIEFISSLSPDQRDDLLAGLQSRIKADAKSMAITMASALTANLKVSGRRDLAEISQSISDALLEKRQ